MATSQAKSVESLYRDTSSPRVNSVRLDTPQPPLQEVNVLSDHLQSAINSILELQRLQGATAEATDATTASWRDACELTQLYSPQ